MRCLREEIGLDSPPKAYYTNDMQRVNEFPPQREYQLQKTAMGVFNDKMKKVVQQQQREIEKAVINCGKISTIICTQYSFLALPEDKWFRMTETQLVQHLKKLNMCSVRENSQQYYGENNSNETDQSLQCHNITVGQFQLSQSYSLSVSYEDAIVILDYLKK